MDKLDEIMAWKRQEVAERARTIGDDELAAARRPHPGFIDSLRAAQGIGVIAEIKRRSPSAGDIAAGIPALEKAASYRAAGADCLSILTDEKYFGGALSDLAEVTAGLPQTGRALPALRKDFFVHRIQVLEAAQAGAACILLIVRALEDADLRDLAQAAQMAGLDALWEVHTEREVERALACGAQLIGINNRDLAVFRTDLGLSERLIPLLPKHCLAVSESGIFTAADARRVKAAGARALLVGEALMRSAEPAALIADFKAA